MGARKGEMGSQRLTGGFVRAGFILFPVMVAMCVEFSQMSLSLWELRMTGEPCLCGQGGERERGREGRGRREIETTTLRTYREDKMGVRSM